MTDDDKSRVLAILEAIVTGDSTDLVERLNDLERWRDEVEAVWPQIVEDL